MSAAIRAKSARARATIARNIYVRNKSGEFGRARDHCFEMGDGDEVARLLAERVKTDHVFRAAILRHWHSAPLLVLSEIFGQDANKMDHAAMKAAAEACA
jgi:hypothetical protein